MSAGKNKAELTAEALGLGIDLSDDPTKAVIQERIDQKMEEMAANLMNPDTLLGDAEERPRGRFRGGRGDQNHG
jgi:hypothetical protein